MKFVSNRSLSILYKYLFIISISLSLLSCSTKTSHKQIKGDKHISISLKIAEPSTTKNISETADIIQKRLINYGIPEENIIIKMPLNGIDIDIKYADDPKRIISLITKPGKFEFWETYELKDIYQFLDKADKILKDSFYATDNIGKVTIKEIKVKTDSSENLSLIDKASNNRNLNSQVNNKDILLKSNPLFTYLRISTAKDESGNNVLRKGPFIGQCEIEDTAVVNKMLSQRYVKSLFPGNLKLAWSVKSGNNGTTALDLIALRYSNFNKEPALTGEVIADASQNYDKTSCVEISISMNSEGAKIWKQLTKDNIGKSIAIVLDNYVYSSPIVMDEISNGNSMITGNFTKEEAEDLATLIKFHCLPVSISILNSKITEEPK